MQPPPVLQQAVDAMAHRLDRTLVLLAARRPNWWAILEITNGKARCLFRAAPAAKLYRLVSGKRSLLPFCIVFLLTATRVLACIPPDVPQHPYSVVTSTCVPGISAAQYLHTLSDRMRFGAGRYLSHSMAHIRCAIAERGKAGWNTMTVYYHDPDGLRGASRVLATLYRQESSHPPTPLAQLDSDFYPSTAVTLSSRSVPISQPVFLFSRYRYWVDIALGRFTATAISPVIGSVVFHSIYRSGC